MGTTWNGGVCMDQFDLHFSPQFLLAIIYEENEEYVTLFDEYSADSYVIKIMELIDEYDGLNAIEVVQKLDKLLLMFQKEVSGQTGTF